MRMILINNFIKMSFECNIKSIHFIKTFVLYGLLITSLHVYSDEPLKNNSLSSDNLSIRNTSLIDDLNDRVTDSHDWSLHTQSTYIYQQKNNFYSPYHGQNSLLNKSEGGGDKSYTFSTTAFIGKRLWTGTEFFINPEIFQGMPFNGQLVGLGGFQNGELQKGAFESPVYYTARAFLRQTINLDGEEENAPGGANQFKGLASKNRLVLSFGKLASLDYFDDNLYSHDPRTQFQNFSIFSMGAFGYAADIKGFTVGGVAEWYQDNWIVKVARLALPMIPNTPQLDYSLKKNYADQIELTRFHQIANQPGAFRTLLYRQNAYMASYQDAIDTSLQNKLPPEIIDNRKNSNSSWGYGINTEQAINEDIGIFARWSWNTGATETQTLDISKSLAFGASVKGSYWSRPEDTMGLGYALNGISSAEINYLKLGGMTAFIGDGNISYKPETIFECYYNTSLNKVLNLTLDIQKITNPSYNSARGPVNILGLRLHFEI